MVRDMQLDLARLRVVAGLGFSTATDLASWLARVLRLPFRSAHQVTAVVPVQVGGLPASRRGKELTPPLRVGLQPKSVVAET